jgi:hypothetical protein
MGLDTAGSLVLIVFGIYLGSDCMFVTNFSSGVKLSLQHSRQFWQCVIIRLWKDHFKSDLRSYQDHLLKKDLRSDQDHIYFLNDLDLISRSKIKVPFLR